MILTQCAVCAIDLGLTSGKKCGRCSTRYCGPATASAAAVHEGEPGVRREGRQEHDQASHFYVLGQPFVSRFTPARSGTKEALCGLSPHYSTKRLITDRFLLQGGVIDRGRGGVLTLPASGSRH